MSEPEPGKEVVRGWWFPVFLIEYYDEGKITEAEFMLLGKINSFDDCRASNRWLGKWWGNRVPKYVSQAIQKLKGLGLLKVKVDKYGHRHMETCFKSDEGCLFKQAGCPKFRDGVPEISGSDLGIAKAKSSKTSAGHKARSVPVVKPTFDLESPNNNGHTYSPVVIKYARLAKKAGFHLRNGNLRKGTNKGGWTAQTLAAWDRDYKQLRSFASKEEVKEVLQWFFDHHQDQWVPVAHTFSTFCDKFDQIQKAMVRSQAKIRKEQAETGYTDDSQVTQEEIEQMEKNRKNREKAIRAYRKRHGIAE